MAESTRRLGDLISIGPAMLRDFELLRIRSVVQLARQNPERMYSTLNRLTGKRQDPCVLDTFCAWWRKRRIRGCPPSNARGGIGARSGRRGRNEKTGKRRGTENTEKGGEAEKVRAGKEIGADNAGLGAA